MTDLEWPLWVVLTVGAGTFAGAIVMVNRMALLLGGWVARGVRYAAKPDVNLLTNELESVLDDIAYIRSELTIDGKPGSVKATLYDVSRKFDEHMREFHTT